MTATHEGYHAFTAPTRLGAKEPDHLTTCNAVESERKLFAHRSNHTENDQKFYMKETAVPKNIEPSICCALAVALGISLAIAMEYSIPSRWRSRSVVNWRQNVSTMGFLIYIRERISSWERLGVRVMPKFKLKKTQLETPGLSHGNTGFWSFWPNNPTPVSSRVKVPWHSLKMSLEKKKSPIFGFFVHSQISFFLSEKPVTQFSFFSKIHPENDNFARYFHSEEECRQLIHVET